MTGISVNDANIWSGIGSAGRNRQCFATAVAADVDGIANGAGYEANCYRSWFHEE
jgi:hypothetical protein